MTERWYKMTERWYGTTEGSPVLQNYSITVLQYYDYGMTERGYGMTWGDSHRDDGAENGITLSGLRFLHGRDRWKLS